MKLYGGSGKRESGKPQSDSGRNTDSGLNHRQSPNEDKPRKNKEQERRAPAKKGKAGKVLLIILLVLLVLIGSLYAYWRITSRPPETQTEAPGSENQPDEPVTPANRYYTILVAGIDQEEGNTDTMMLLRYDTQEKTANIVSIPRDAMINTENPNKKINNAYKYAENKGENGIDALMDAVKGITGFRPDSYVFIDMDVFVQSIDMLGGVWFDVPLDMDYVDDTPGKDYVFTIKVSKGYQLLSGYDALGVFRWRQNSDKTGYIRGDIDRLETQHKLIKAVAGQALQLKNVGKLIEIAQLVLSKAETNLTIGNMQWYAEEFMKMSLDGINFISMPTSERWINRTAYLSINVEEWLEVVNASLSPFDTLITPEHCNLFGVRQDEPNRTTVTPDFYYSTNGSEVHTNFYYNPY